MYKCTLDYFKCTLFDEIVEKCIFQRVCLAFFENALPTELLTFNWRTEVRTNSNYPTWFCFRKKQHMT